MRQTRDERSEARGSAIAVVGGFTESFVLALEPPTTDPHGGIEHRFARGCAYWMTLKQRSSQSGKSVDIRQSRALGKKITNGDFGSSFNSWNEVANVAIEALSSLRPQDAKSRLP
jgi:hypothetical protein